MSKKKEQEAEIKSAIGRLERISLTDRCRLLGLPAPENGVVKVRAFGCNYLLLYPGYDLIDAKTKEPVDPGDHILVLRYLLYDLRAASGGEMISFRDFPGGQFYWQTFLSRTVEPLVAGIGNDLGKLKKNLKRFDWTPLKLGSLGARIHTIGNMYLNLIYHRGDEEYPPTADIYFDPVIRRIYSAEDAAALASRICRGLVPEIYRLSDTDEAEVDTEED